jgi:hypothetical protein
MYMSHMDFIFDFDQAQITLIKKIRKFSSYMYKVTQNGTVAKSRMTNGLLIYVPLVKYLRFLIY